MPPAQTTNVWVDEMHAIVANACHQRTFGQQRLVELSSSAEEGLIPPAHGYGMVLPPARGGARGGLRLSRHASRRRVCPDALLPLLELLSLCAELGVFFAKLTLARMHFECKNDAVRQLLATCVSPAAALAYLLEAADVHNDCEAHALLGTLHFDWNSGRGAVAPVRADSPFPFNADKSIDHFKKAVESYDALAEPKQLVTRHILGAFSREKVMIRVCVTATMYMNNPTGLLFDDRPFVSQDPKRSRAVFKWAASKGFSPAVAILGGANPKCAHCGGNKPSNHCPGCMCTRYCSRECQRKHWGNHKGECLTVFHEVLANIGVKGQSQRRMPNRIP